MNPRALFLLAVLSGILLCPAQAQQLQKKSGQAALPAGVGSIEGIEYAKHSGISLQLDLYRPKDANGPVPAIVFVHGANGPTKSTIATPPSDG
jgi:acetyl esterase/lipase